MTGPAEQGWVRRLAGRVLVHRLPLLLGLTGAVFGSATQALVPLVARHIVDHVIIARAAALWPWLLVLIGAALLTFAMAYLRRYYSGVLSLSVQNDLRNAMHDRLLVMDQDSLARMPTGQLVARANSDSTLVQALLQFVPMMSSNILLMLISLGVMLWLSPVLALVAIAVLPALFFISYRMRTLVFPASWEGQQREGDVAQIVDESVNGVRVVKAFGQERRELQRVVTAAETLYGARMRTVRLQARFQPLMKSVPSLAQVAILGFGGWMTVQGSISIGTFLAFSTYVAQFAAPARTLANVLTVAQQARAGVERIFQLLDQKPAIADSPGAVELPREVRGEIVFDDVHFRYGDTEILRGVDLRVRPGERIAIVGASGSGKSTVVSLVSRFHDPAAGSVRVDGHDLREITLASLRRHVSVAFEDSFLFSDSVRANIAYGLPDATQEQIEAAARSAQAHEFIADLPDGYDTQVGERGLTLSGGQRQRIALARAILADPAILVLDDATSAVDARTEEAIHDALRGVLQGRTTLLIAHRLSTLRLADRVAVLVDGRITEQGTHEELLASSDTYQGLLSGLGDDTRGAAGDRIESLTAVAGSSQADPGVTATAWQPPAQRNGPARRVAFGGPSLGAGIPGGGGGWRLALAATPELLAKVATLPPVKDHAKVDVETESRRDRHFTLRTLLKEFHSPLLIGLALVVLDALSGLAGPILVRIGLDNGVVKDSRSVLFWATAVFLAITAVAFVDQIAETFVTGRAAERIMLSLRVRIWAQLQRLSLDYYEREMAGRIMTRMTTDVDQFESLIENGLLNAVVALATFVGVGIALVIVNLELGLWTLTVIIPLAVGTVIFRRFSARLYNIARDRIAVVNAEFQENLSGIRETQAFVHEAATIRHFHTLGRQYLDVRIRAQRLIAIYFPFVQLLAAAADAVVLGVGAVLISRGHLTAGVLIAFMLYIDMFFSPIQQLSQVFDSWQQTRISVERIAELMRLDPLTPDPQQPVTVGRLSGATALTDVHFRYPQVRARPGREQLRGPVDARNPQRVEVPKTPEALRGIDLTIRPGETVALVGETGAGKSTVMKLLARFYDPDTGTVTMDAHDLRTVDPHGFRTQLGYVPQEAFLFSGTVRDNIAYGRPSATDAEVEAAARAVGAHDFVATLPGGYLHTLAERGRGLSAGQRQLLALARAELVDPAILLLDEATSNLDLVSEARVAEAMQRLAAHRTTVLIAHRLQTARTADRIFVLDKGRIAEVGSHEELLEANGRYARMWRAFELVSS